MAVPPSCIPVDFSARLDHLIPDWYLIDNLSTLLALGEILPFQLNFDWSTNYLFLNLSHFLTHYNLGFLTQSFPHSIQDNLIGCQIILLLVHTQIDNEIIFDQPLIFETEQLFGGSCN